MPVGTIRGRSLRLPATHPDSCLRSGGDARARTQENVQIHVQLAWGPTPTRDAFAPQGSAYLHDSLAWGPTPTRDAFAPQGSAYLHDSLAWGPPPRAMRSPRRAPHIFTIYELDSRGNLCIFQRRIAP
jgi:hypothetical protein